jgi:type IV fimbrial biogenesis protein FimT
MLGDPQGRKLLTVHRLAPRRRVCGISLIELMITISIFTILALMALPMYSTWIAGQKVRAAAESVLNGIHVARGEAIKRNQPVRIVLDPTVGWEVQLVSDDSVVRKEDFKEGSKQVALTVTPVGTTTVVFDGLGRVLDSALAPLAARITVEIDTTSGFSGVRKQRVVIDTAAATGVGIRSCDPGLASTDPRGCPT